MPYRPAVAIISSLFLSSLAAHAYAQDAPVAVALEEALRFEPNQGQSSSEVRFISRGPGYDLAITPKDAILTLQNPGEAASTMRMKMVDGKRPSEVFGTDRQVSRTNYLIGNNPGRWITDVPNFGKVFLRDVYTGIDMVYYGNQGKLEYDFIVAPGIDPNTIRLAFEGPEHIELTPEGHLQFALEGGKITMHRPLVYQEIDGHREVIAATYRLDQGEVQFALASYDESKPLVIDPTVAFFGYFGGLLGGANGSDTARAVAVDAAGNAYVTGLARSNSGFATQFDTSLGNSSGDAYVAKFNSAGVRQWATYIGGNQLDEGLGIAVDSLGVSYIVGKTDSTTFPMAGAFQTTNQGAVDGFITKLNANGNQLLASTYFGGIGMDRADAIKISGTNVHVVGVTESKLDSILAQFPLFPGGRAAFALKLNLNLQFDASSYGHYIPGVIDLPSARASNISVAIDASGNAYVAGTTNAGSTTLLAPLALCPILSVACANGNYKGGTSDGFVVKLSSTGALMAVSYIGGSAQDVIHAVAVDASENVYVAGETFSTNLCNLAACTGGHQANKKGSFDAFYVRLDAAGALTYGTYLGSGPGSSGADRALGIALETSGNVLVVGRAALPDFPSTGTIHSFYGSINGFLTTFSPTNGFLSSTFIRPADGTPGADSNAQHDVEGVATDVAGNAILVGTTAISSDTSPFAAKIAGSGAPSIAIVDLTLSPASVALPQDASTGLLLSIGTLTLDRPLTGSTPAILTSASTQILNLASTDGGTVWTFEVRLITPIPPGTSTVKIEAQIDAAACSSEICRETLTLAGIPTVQCVTFQSNCPRLGDPPEIVGGNSSTGQVRLTTGTPTSVSVALTAAPAGVLLGLASAVSITTSTTSTSFAIGTAVVSSITSVDVSASVPTGSGQTARTGVLVVLPDVKMVGLTLNPASPLTAISDTSVSATVTLNQIVPNNPAYYPAAGIPFTLESNGNVLGNFHIPLGQGGATVSFAAPSVSVPTSYPIVARVAITPETNASSSNTATLDVVPLRIATFALAGPVQGGANVSGTITLNSNQISGTRAISFSQTPISPALALPVSVSFLNGVGTFTFPSPVVLTDTTFTVTASINGTPAASANITILAVAAGVAQLTLPPSAFSGSPVTTTVKLNTTASGSFAIQWTQAPAIPAIVFPASVSFTNGTGTASFTAPHVAADTLFTITASLNGGSAPAQVLIRKPGALTVPFKKFDPDVRVYMRRGDDRDSFLLRSDFTLGETTNGINPVLEPVTLKVGPYQVTLPPGSFKLDGDRDGDGDYDRKGRVKKLSYRFKGTVGGGVLDIRIRSFGRNDYDIRAHARRVDLTGVIKGQPIPVKLEIGNDSGETTDSNPKLLMKDLKAQLTVDLDRRDGDTFDLQVDFKLDDSSDGINPATEPVTIQVGPYEVTIPAGSFRPGSNNDRKIVAIYRYDGTINGVKLDVTIRNYGHNTWDLDASGRRSDLDGIVKGHPVTAGLGIGNDVDEVEINKPKVK